MNDKSEDFWLGVAAFPVAVAAFCGGIILEGFVLSIMWGWFMVPFGLPHITVAWAIGVSVLTSLFQPTPLGKPSNSEFWFALTVKPLLILLIGWIAKQWM